MASSLAKKTRSSSTIDISRACSNGRSGENKYGIGVSHSESRVGTI